MAKGYGIKFGEGSRLQNLRFADDILLVGNSLAEVTNFARVARCGGHQSWFGDTPRQEKMLSNRQRSKCSEVNFEFGKIEILARESNTEYLGRLLGFQDYHDSEIKHRIAKGWAKFHRFKEDLCCRHYPLKDRMRLFNAIITPTVLYGSSTWTMTKDRERRLQTAQRMMIGRFSKHQGIHTRRSLGLSGSSVRPIKQKHSCAPRVSSHG